VYINMAEARPAGVISTTSRQRWQSIMKSDTFLEMAPKLVEKRKENEEKRVSGERFTMVVREVVTAQRNMRSKAVLTATTNLDCKHVEDVRDAVLRNTQIISGEISMGRHVLDNLKEGENEQKDQAELASKSHTGVQEMLLETIRPWYIISNVHIASWDSFVRILVVTIVIYAPYEVISLSFHLTSQGGGRDRAGKRRGGRYIKQGGEAQ